MSAQTSKNTVLATVKLYVFPSLVTILAMMIWRDVTELRSDVKALLAQSNIDKTRIDNLERDVKFLEQSVFGPKQKPLAYNQPYHDKYFKHEELFDESKYIKNKQL